MCCLIILILLSVFFFFSFFLFFFFSGGGGGGVMGQKYYFVLNALLKHANCIGESPNSKGYVIDRLSYLVQHKALESDLQLTERGVVGHYTPTPKPHTHTHIYIYINNIYTCTYPHIKVCALSRRFNKQFAGSHLPRTFSA